MKTKTKLKRENRKRLKTKTKTVKTKTKMPKQQNLSLNESASIQYGAYGCYGRTALNPWLTVDGIYADHQHVFWKETKTGKLKLKLKVKNKSKRKSHCITLSNCQPVLCMAVRCMLSLLNTLLSQPSVETCPPIIMCRFQYHQGLFLFRVGTACTQTGKRKSTSSVLFSLHLYTVFSYRLMFLL